ncbi:MAG: hypothetical protein Q7R50_00045 [Dehalococcoidales bacterium]|nr:hypothetical protein [Dehalococcoidales bacterium]
MATTFAKGDRVRFSFSGEIVIAELFTIHGSIQRRRVVNGHYVYNVKLSARVNLPTNMIYGMKLINGTLLTGVSGNLLELLR